MTISSWLNFGRPAPPGRGSAAGRNFLAPPYYSRRAVFASPLSAFFIIIGLVIRLAYLDKLNILPKLIELHVDTGWRRRPLCCQSYCNMSSFMWNRGRSSAHCEAVKCKYIRLVYADAGLPRYIQYWLNLRHKNRIAALLYSCATQIGLQWDGFVPTGQHLSHDK